MGYKNIIKNNLKFIISMSVVIVLGIIGVTFALAYSSEVGISIETSQLKANITYLNGSSSTITSTGKLIPINDSNLTIDSSTTNSNIIKIDFKVAGVSTNPTNTIMDISLNDIDMDCELKSEYFKWKLYKNSELLNTGSFSPKYDILANNRLVLTNTQEELTTSLDTYSLIIYIAESCTGDVNVCDETFNQDTLLNKSFNATMKLELSTGRTKTNTRTTSTETACSLTDDVSVPSCTSRTYNGSSQTLISSNAKYTLTNATGTNAGNYIVVAKLASGYKWLDNTTSEKVIECSITKKELTITANDQEIRITHNGDDFGETVEFVTSSGLVSGHKINKIYLYTPQYEIGTGIIYASGAQIVDSSGNDMTNNYQINYVNGTVTIE